MNGNVMWKDGGLKLVVREQRACPRLPIIVRERSVLKEESPVQWALAFVDRSIVRQNERRSCVPFSDAAGTACVRRASASTFDPYVRSGPASRARRLRSPCPAGA